MAADEKFDLIVIGSGPGGYVAAARAARAGLSVACIEKDERPGGTCLNVGCIPSKALLESSAHYHLARTRFAVHGIETGTLRLDLSAMMKRKEGVVSGLTENVRQLLESGKVALIRGTARLEGGGTVSVVGGERNRPARYRADSILLATGSVPATPPDISFDGDRVVSSTEALCFADVPRHLIVIGGGYIGLELGSVWLRLGAKVTVVEMLPGIAAGLDAQVSRMLQRLLAKQGMVFKTGTRVTGIKPAAKFVGVFLEKGEATETIRGDRVLVAVGRKPNTAGLGLKDAGVETDPKTGHVVVDDRFKTSAGGIYAIGDLVAGPALAHKASAEGTAVADLVTGKTARVNTAAIPAVIYTDPEVAMVGLTEAAAKERGKVCVGTYPFTGIGRARCAGDTDGFVKLVSDAATDRLLGAHIIGPRASELIAECVLAMEFGASAEDIARTVHSHPTFSEAVMEAAETAYRCAEKGEAR